MQAEVMKMQSTASHRNQRFDARHGRFLRQAPRSLAEAISGGSDCYDRSRHLARLLPIGPDEIADESPAARRAILAKLSRALRAERNRGRSGHWTYDLNRHLALSQAYAAESRIAKSGPAAR
jgi:hypothetical protein